MAAKRSNLGWWIFGISIVVGVPMLIYFGLGGYVQGEEFSPDDFSRRAFSYNIMPFFNICLQGVDYRDKTPVFEQTLLNDGYLGENANVKLKRWHLVTDDASDLESRDFDAKILIRFLDLKNNEFESIWIQFNEDHPDLATEFWPIVADMARNYLYVDLAEIMARAARITPDRVDDFKSFMISKASRALMDLADQKQSSNESELALELYERVLELAPNPRAADGKSACLEALNESAD